MTRYMCWEQLYAFSDTPLDIGHPLTLRIQIYWETDKLLIHEQQTSINIHLVTILAGSLEWPEGDFAKYRVGQGGSQAPEVGR